MNVNFRSVNDIPYFQEGGPMPAGDPGMQEGAPEGAPAPEEGAAPLGGNPEDQLAGVAQLLVQMLMQQVGDPQAVAAILLMALEMVQGGGGEQAPEPQLEPVYRRGGRLLRRINK